MAEGLPQGDRDLIALKMLQNRDKVTAQEAEGSVKPQHESGSAGLLSSDSQTVSLKPPRDAPEGEEGAEQRAFEPPSHSELPGLSLGARENSHGAKKFHS